MSDIVSVVKTPEELKEYNEQQLKLLIEKLKDIDNFTGFKNGAYVYYLNWYEARILIEHIEENENKLE